MPRLRLPPALLVPDLLLGKRLGLDAQRRELVAGDEVVYVGRDGLDAGAEVLRVAGQVVGGERLHGEGEVHDLDRGAGGRRGGGGRGRSPSRGGPGGGRRAPARRRWGP